MKNIKAQTCSDCGAELDEQGICPNGCNTDDYGLCDLEECQLEEEDNETSY